MLIFMSPSHHPYPFVNVKLPLQSPERREERTPSFASFFHRCGNLKGNPDPRCSDSPVEQHYCVPALPSAAAHPPLLSKGLEEQRAAEHVRNRRVGASFLSLTAASWICDSVRFSLLLISNVLSVDQDVAVMSVTRCCVQNSSREVVQFSGFLS